MRNSVYYLLLLLAGLISGTKTFAQSIGSGDVKVKHASDELMEGSANVPF